LSRTAGSHLHLRRAVPIEGRVPDTDRARWSAQATCYYTPHARARTDRGRGAGGGVLSVSPCRPYITVLSVPVVRIHHCHRPPTAQSPSSVAHLSTSTSWSAVRTSLPSQLELCSSGVRPRPTPRRSIAKRRRKTVRPHSLSPTHPLYHPLTDTLPPPLSLTLTLSLSLSHTHPPSLSPSLSHTHTRAHACTLTHSLTRAPSCARTHGRSHVRRLLITAL
jgi:hypothetical protein